jgi:putative oxidoreductase
MSLKTIKSFFLRAGAGFNHICDSLIAPGDLFVRYWVGRIFFVSAVKSIESWQDTMNFFIHDYDLPLLSDTAEAYLVTGVNLIAPIFLILGFGGRFPAFILFFFNFIGVFAYPFLLTRAGHIDLTNHFYWGILLMMILLHGPGKLSLDEFFRWKRANSLDEIKPM